MSPQQLGGPEFYHDQGGPASHFIGIMSWHLPKKVDLFISIDVAFVNWCFKPWSGLKRIFPAINTLNGSF
jgi:hypothetical protein